MLTSERVVTNSITNAAVTQGPQALVASPWKGTFLSWGGRQGKTSLINTYQVSWDKLKKRVEEVMELCSNASQMDHERFVSTES